MGLLAPLAQAERLRPLQWLGPACAFIAAAFAWREGFMVRNRGLTRRANLLGL